jgi:hypothetical protein
VVQGLVFIAVIVLFRYGLAGLVETLFGRKRHGRAA